MHLHKYGIPQLSEQLSLSLLQPRDSHPYQPLTFQSLLFDFFVFCLFVFQRVFRFLFFVTSPQHLVFAPSVSVFPFLPPKDTAVSGIRPGCGLILTGQWAMQAFFSPQWAPEWSIYPEMCSAGPALPTILIASDVLDSVQLTSKETRYIIVPRGTSGDQAYTSSVCSHQ